MVYSFEDVLATLVGPGGAIPLGAGSGSAKEGISVDFLDAKDVLLMGADGKGAHSLRASKAARITVRLLKTSPWNAALSALYSYQSSSSLFWAQNVLTVTNPVTGDDYRCTEVAFEKHTPITWAEDANINEWPFLATYADPILGVGI